MEFKKLLYFSRINFDADQMYKYKTCMYHRAFRHKWPHNGCRGQLAIPHKVTANTSAMLMPSL